MLNLRKKAFVAIVTTLLLLGAVFVGALAGFVSSPGTINHVAKAGTATGPWAYAIDSGNVLFSDSAGTSGTCPTYPGYVSPINLSANPPTKGTDIQVGISPAGGAFTPDGNLLFVPNLCSGTVSVINTNPLSAKFNTVVSTITVATAGNNTAEAASVTPDGSELWVTNDSGATTGTTLPNGVLVYSIDEVTNTFSLIKSITLTAPANSCKQSDTPGTTGSMTRSCSGTALLPQPKGVAISPDGSTAYVLDGSNSATGTPCNCSNDVLYEINTQTFNITDVSIFVAGASGSGAPSDNTQAPFSLNLTPDGKQVFIGTEGLIYSNGTSSQDYVSPEVELDLPSGNLHAVDSVTTNCNSIGGLTATICAQVLPTQAITPDGKYVYVPHLCIALEANEGFLGTYYGGCEVSGNPSRGWIDTVQSYNNSAISTYTLQPQSLSNPQDWCATGCTSNPSDSGQFLTGMTVSPDGSMLIQAESDNSEYTGNTPTSVTTTGQVNIYCISTNSPDCSSKTGASPTNPILLTPTGGGIKVGSSPAGVVVQPDQAPVASLTVTGTVSSCNNSSVSFTAGGTTEFGSITTYNWNFGDGTTTSTTSNTATHTYTSPGNYVATVTEVDSAETSLTETVQLYNGGGTPSTTTVQQVSNGVQVLNNGGPLAQADQASVEVSLPNVNSVDQIWTANGGLQAGNQPIHSGLSNPNAVVGQISALASQQQNGVLWVSNIGFSKGSIEEFNTYNNSVINTVNLNSTDPKSMVITPNGKYLVVADYGDNGGTPDVEVINTQTLAVSAVAMPSGFFPRSVAVSPNGQNAWVSLVNATSGSNGEVVEVTGIGGTLGLGSPITVGVNPKQIVLNQVGTVAYVLNVGTTSVAATISVVSPLNPGASPSVIKTLTLPTDTYQAEALSSSGNTLLVTGNNGSTGNGAVYQIGISSGYTVPTSPSLTGVGGAPASIYVQGAYAYIASYLGEEVSEITGLDGALSIVTGSPLATPGGNAFEIGLAYNSICQLVGQQSTYTASSVAQAIVAEPGTNSLQAFGVPGGAQLTSGPVATGASLDEKVAVNANQNIALATNFGSNSVSLFTLSPYGIANTVSVPGNPFGVAAVPSSNDFYVTENGAGNIVRIYTNYASTGVPLYAGAGALNIVINSAGTLAYVTNYGAGAISTINLSTGAWSAIPTTSQVVNGITLGNDPYGIAISPNGNYLYVTFPSEHALAVLSTSNMQYVSAIQFPNLTPLNVAATGNGTYAVVTTPYSSSSGAGGNGNSFQLVNVSTPTSLTATTVSLPFGSQPYDVATFVQTDQYAMISVEGLNQLVEYDVTTASVAATISLPSGAIPAGVGINP